MVAANAARGAQYKSYCSTNGGHGDEDQYEDINNKGNTVYGEEEDNSVQLVKRQVKKW